MSMRARIHTRKTVYNADYLRVDRMDITATDSVSEKSSAVHTRECLIMHDSVAILLYDPKPDSIVLIEQIRPGALVRRDDDDACDGIALEVVAGTVETGEDKRMAAEREVREEAAVDVLAIEEIGNYLLCPGYSSEKMTLFCACVDSDVTSSTQHELTGLADEHEYIHPKLFPADAVQNILMHPQLTMPAVALLHWFLHHHDRIRAQWRNVR